MTPSVSAALSERVAVPITSIRLAFWAAEETGIHGSTHYVTGLSDQERARIVAYLNADMLASPNGYAGVYDGVGMPSGSSAEATVSHRNSPSGRSVRGRKPSTSV